MRPFALAVALLLLASPAAAIKVGVFTQNSGQYGGTNTGFTANQIQSCLETLGMAGQPYTPFNADARTWGETGKADSVWFREQGYTDLIVLAEDGQAQGIPVIGGPWGLNFRDNGSDFRVQDSPLSGLWGMRVYCFERASIKVTASYDQDLAGTTDRFIAGITHTSPSGSFATPTDPDSYRLLCRVRGSQTDTLYCDPTIMACRPGTWAGSGTVAALAWSTDLGSCTAGDTMVAAWRFRPALPGGGEGPGITFFLFRLDYGNGQNLSTLWTLQHAYAASGERAPMVIPIDLNEHDVEAGDETNATSRRHHAAFESTMVANNWTRRIATPMNPSEYTNFYNPATLSTIRRSFSSLGSTWAPFSYSSGADAWNFIFFNASDTAGVRSRFNQVARTTSHADSGAFPRVRYNVSSLVTGGGTVGAWQSRVLADAGVRRVETLLMADRGPFDYVAPVDTGWALIAQSNGYAPNALPFQVPGTSETRVLYVCPTYGFPHQSTFTTLRDVTEGFQYIGQQWVNTIGVASTRLVTVYWHRNTITNQDPYAAWLWGVAARKINCFDRVIEINRTTRTRVFTPRRTFTARY